MSETNSWFGVRCLFESPILDERKWAKIPGIPADAFILDLEDAVPINGKVAAREKVTEFLGRQEDFDGRLTVARPNPLDTPWGVDDIVALARAGAKTVMISKVNSVRDIDEALTIFSGEGSMPSIVASIESAAGVLNARDILNHPSVVASTFGAGDLHADAGMELYEPDGTMNPGLLYPKVHTVLAAVAAHVPVLSIAYGPNIKDLEDIRIRMEAEKRIGFNGLCAFYPPHVDLINDIYTPSEQDVASAMNIIAIYEQAQAEGKPAVQTAEGVAILAHQYKGAQHLLARQK